MLECVPNHLEIMEIIIWPLTLVNYFFDSTENNLPGCFSLTM